MTSRHESIRHFSDPELERQGKGEFTLDYSLGGSGQIDCSSWYPTNYQGITYAVRESSRGANPPERARTKALLQVHAFLNENPMQPFKTTVKYKVSLTHLTSKGNNIPKRKNPS